MYFKLLPEHIKEAIVKLTKDEEFQHRFATDEILDKIDDMKINHAEEYQLLLSIFGKKHVIENIELPFITPGIWSFLWSIKSPIVFAEEITNIDVDIFMYVLFNRYFK